MVKLLKLKRGIEKITHHVFSNWEMPYFKARDYRDILDFCRSPSLSRPFVTFGYTVVFWIFLKLKDWEKIDSDDKLNFQIILHVIPTQII